jgi:Tol biopolymer transport system component
MILEEFRANTPSMGECSPDGKLLLLKKKIVNHSSSRDAEELTVESIAQGAVMFRRESQTSPLRLRWRPDGKAISYFRHQIGSNDRKLFVWDLASNLEKEIPIPQSSSQKQVRWSPDSRKLAYISSGGILCVVDLASKKTTSFPGPFQHFDWDSASRHIAVLFADQVNKVQIFSLSGEAVARHFDPKLVFRELAWQNGNRILLRAHDSETDHAKLITTDAELRSFEELLTVDTPISTVAWTWENGITFCANRGV